MQSHQMRQTYNPPEFNGQHLGLLKEVVVSPEKARDLFQNSKEIWKTLPQKKGSARRHAAGGSVHVEITLEDALLESVRLRSSRGSFDGGGLGGRRWHVGDRLGAVVDRSCRSRRRVGHGEGGTGASGHVALGAGPKLLGPVETLLV
jgi:hypothetical protein